jgi:hypothetical protein
LFEVLQSQLPDFHDPSWHKVLLFPGKTSTTFLAPKTMKEFIKDMYKAALNWCRQKIVRSPKRHTGRHLGSNFCLDAGVPHPDQLSLGGWGGEFLDVSGKVKITHYDKTLPQKALLAMAGCNLLFRHEHPRFTMNPELSFGAEYVSIMFPRLAAHLQQSIDQAKSKSQLRLPRDESDQLERHLQHLQYFMQSVQFMAMCLFQDMVLMKEKFPNLSVWNNEAPFLHQQWPLWEEGLKEHVASRPDTALTGGVDRTQEKIEAALFSTWSRHFQPHPATPSGVPPTNKPTHKKRNKQANTQTNTQTHKPTNQQTHTHTHTNKQTNKQTTT